MPTNPIKESVGNSAAAEKQAVQAPTISLPKGGGAIRGMGEKFGSNPVTGTGSMTVPIATSPGRSGFGPQLALSYDSGAGNGPFGLGWSLSLPSITRKTDKGLPKYLDGDESDVFILSGAEDLVPVLVKQGDSWVRQNLPLRKVNRVNYRIQRYRPRIEGLFARIERWTNTDTGEIHWRSISKENITTLYGKDNNSRIFDPEDPDPLHPTRIFTWLICQTYDDKGNAMRYEYVAEDSRNVGTSPVCERNRTHDSRSANRYLKRIHYGNETSLLANGQSIPPLGPDLSLMKWLFEVVFDYGDGHLLSLSQPTDDPQPARASVSPSSAWPVRADPFSSCRTGFDVRTYRLCRRVLMFHHFAAELGTPDYLVRSTEFAYRETPIASFIVAVSQSGYLHQPLPSQPDRYLKKSLPPLEFQYSEATIDSTVRELAPDSLENLPIGLDGGAYRWVDLDGEGLSGILTEQANGWFYKRNLSPINVVGDNGSAHVEARFAPVELVTTKPSSGLAAGRAQFMDLAGDGQPDLVTFRGPTPGFYERTPEAGNWKPFTPFALLPVLDWDDPNLKFVDLTGDGNADLLITDDEVFRWHPSLAEEGFGPQETARQSRDEEKGPRLVFADGTQSIYLADMSGDGLTDLVRISNGNVCYWPNLGYGRFGAKVTMDNSPWFDFPDQFDQKRIRLADVDGSGLTDILYLHGDGVRIYFNQSGNSWSQPPTAPAFPRIDSHASVTVVDLLGNGTACLVWSSALPGDALRQMRYIDLMGGQKPDRPDDPICSKPHLLIRTRNNLGAETVVSYAPSTKFYLQDKRDGKPWLTKLPFPVHCVEKVTVTDTWRKTKFSTTYTYHHGYFDGVEREFRGFGRVEQVDTESYGKVAAANADSPYVTPDQTLWQPPVKSVTWFHTGIAEDRSRILGLYEREYFPTQFAAQLAEAEFTEKQLPQPSIDKGDAASPALDAGEWREAMRACKGMVLRQEAYELDLTALQERGEHKPVRLYSAAQHNCRIRRLQPRVAPSPSPIGWERAGVRADHLHAVFLVMESEALSYQYELALPDQPATLDPDPRIAHTLNLRFDDYGRAEQSVAVVYPRQIPHDDATLSAEQLGVIHAVQTERHLAYTETHFTDELPSDPDKHRLSAPCESLTYELTGADPANGIVPSAPLYFSVDDLAAHHLSDTLPDQGTKAVTPLKYQEQPADNSAHQRLVERAVTLHFKDDLTGPLPFGQQNWLGFTYETYTLALTESLLQDVLENKYDPDTRTALDDFSPAPATAGFRKSGYQIGTSVLGATGVAAEWWMRSGIAGFAANAPDHFYLPERYTDPFGYVTMLKHHAPYFLHVESSTDVVGNTVSVKRFDFRVLAPARMEDANGNVSEAAFDVLGLPVAMAQMGKVVKGPPETSESGDTVAGLTMPDHTALAKFFTKAPFDGRTARLWLGKATARFVYHFGETIDDQGRVTWNVYPASACAILREKHERDAPNIDTPDKTQWIPIQVAFEYSDGGGGVFVKKIQAEPDPESKTANPPLRWIANGKTVLNNKGKPVKQYEPYFTDDHRFSEPIEEGVSPTLFYDAAGRLVRTEMPDGTLSRVDFSPWHVKTFDASDTINEPNNAWYAKRTAAGASAEDKRAAKLSLAHQDTPALTILDSLGREVIAIAHNRVEDANGQRLIDGKRYRDERYLTFTKLDAEGKPLWIRDARGNLVMQYITPPKVNNDPSDATPANAIPCYDIAGNLLFQHSMDAGDRWMLMDVAGKPMLAWDFNERQDGTGRFDEKRLYFTEYDALHRPTAVWLRRWDRPTPTPAAPAVQAYTMHAREKVERFEYQDEVANDVANLNGQLIRHRDPSGLVETVRRDFKGNVQEVRRSLVADGTVSRVDWQSDVNPGGTSKLSAETFTQITEFDALNRMTKHYNWHRASPNNRVAVYQPAYNERGLLLSESLTVRARKTAAGFNTAPDTKTSDAIKEMRYNAKGQKEFLKLGNGNLGNGTITHYDYDKKTFRLKQLRTTRPNYDPPFPAYRADLKDLKVLQQLHYTYDPVGNITEIYDEAYKPAFFQNAIVEPRNLYEYDALYRLIKATGREDGAATGAPPQIETKPREVSFPITGSKALRKYTQTYQYDRVGNIERMHHEAGIGTWTRNYATQPDSNRLLRTWTGTKDWDHTPVGKRTEYLHDTHGNMLNLASTNPRFNMRWDHRDMIGGIDLGGGGLAYYQYDAGKQRTRKCIERNPPDALSHTIKEERIYLGGYELYRRYTGDPNDPVEEIESHHLFEGEQRVLLVDDVVRTRSPRPDGLTVKAQTLFRYQYSNHLGSACLELDHQAKIISYEEYHPYGTSSYRATESGIEAPEKRYRYTGMERDEESGLSYHSARYYVTWLGRWVSADPAGISSGLHFYAYGKGNPCGMRDLTGLQDEQVTKDSRYYAQMADWFYHQGWMDEAKEYQALQHAAAFQEAMAEFRKTRDEGTYISNVVIGGQVAAVGLGVGVVIGATAAGGAVVGATVGGTVRALAIATRLTLQPIVAPSVATASSISGGLVTTGGSTAVALTTGAATTTVAATTTALTTTASVGAATTVVALGTAVAVAANPDPLQINSQASNEFILLRQTTEFLASQGFDEVERRLLIDAGFRSAIDNSTPVTAARFQRILVGELSKRDIGLLRGRLGDLDTRVTTLMKARELEAAGNTIAFEVSVGNFMGADRWLDIGVYSGGVLVEGYQGVKQFGVSDPLVINPREVGLAPTISKGIGVPVHELNTGIQRPLR